MSKEYDSIIYMRSISLDVVIPQKYVWQFMDQFGKKFIVNLSLIHI